MFHHFTINCIWLIVFLQELEQVLVLVKQFTQLHQQKRFYQEVTTHMFHSFPSYLFADGGIYSKHVNSASKVVHLARCETQDLYNTNAPDMKIHSHDPSLRGISLVLI